MPSRYAVLIGDVVTGKIRGELPVESISATHVLNAPGQASVTSPINVGAPFTAADFDPGRSTLTVLRDGTALWSGIVWTWDADIASNGLNLNANGWHSYFRRRYLKADLNFAAVDQATIVKTLVDWAQAQPGGNVGIDTSTVATTGRVRDRTWRAWERHNIGTLIDNLAAVIDGFHFAYPSTFNGSAVSTSLRITYPATGRPTPIVFEMGGNVEMLSITCDGTDMANSAEQIGSGQTAETPIRAAIDTSILATTPLLESCRTASDVSEPSTLQQKADRDLAFGRSPVKLPRLQIGPDVDPVIGTYEVGDRVRVRGRYGVADIDEDYVITEIGFSVRQDAESVDLTVAPIGAFS